MSDSNDLIAGNTKGSAGTFPTFMGEIN